MSDFVGKIYGFIWRGDDQPITMSVLFDEYPNNPVYMQSPQITEGFRRRAKELGISIGELVDQENAKLPAPERAPGAVTWKWNAMSREQLDYTLKTFGLDAADAATARDGDDGGEAT